MRERVIGRAGAVVLLVALSSAACSNGSTPAKTNGPSGPSNVNGERHDGGVDASPLTGAPDTGAGGPAAIPPDASAQTGGADASALPADASALPADAKALIADVNGLAPDAAALVIDAPVVMPDVAPDLLTPMPPPRPSCTPDGSRCANDQTELCSGGRLVAVQPCHALGCRADGTACVAPGSPGALARQGSLGSPACTAPAGPFDSCVSCIRDSCCDLLGPCGEEQNGCGSAWECLAECEGLATCDTCTAKGVTKLTRDVYECAIKAVNNCTSCTLVDPCAGRNGFWCGGKGADANALYLCSNNVTVGAVICGNACIATGGAADHCESPDTCANSPFDGPACGSVLGSASANPNTLYECKGQRTTGTTLCNVCSQAALGKAADCR